MFIPEFLDRLRRVHVSFLHFFFFLLSTLHQIHNIPIGFLCLTETTDLSYSCNVNN